MSFANCDGGMPTGATVDVLGDAISGYIVNVVRDKGEEAVRIAPSISAKLKTHQVFIYYCSYLNMEPIYLLNQIRPPNHFTKLASY